MKKSICVLCSLLFVAACASVTSSNLNNARRSFANDNFLESASNFANNKDIANQDSLELLITGLSQFQAKNYNQSDKAFEEFNKRNIDTIGGSTLREAKGLLLGKLSTEYKPSMMDSLFVSYYQIWDAIGEGRKNDVRVIINQSYARQQDMSREYAEMVEKNNARINDENSELMSKITEKNSVWAAYTDIMNPALMYLSGIWFLNSGDFNDAETYLERANGMAKNNSFIRTDLGLAQRHTKPGNTTWVFIESGFAPMLKQETLSLPVPLGDAMGWVSIAVAEPVFWNGNLSVAGAQHLADVNAMFMTEFNQYRINDALRAWGAASARAIAQAAAYNSSSKYSELMGFMTTLFSVATTQAEVRSWVTLPETISVLRLDTPKSGLIELKSGAKLIANVNVNSNKNNLVYVRITQNTPNIHVMELK
jgi:hypothetical protein